MYDKQKSKIHSQYLINNHTVSYLRVLPLSHTHKNNILKKATVTLQKQQDPLPEIYIENVNYHI